MMIMEVMIVMMVMMVMMVDRDDDNGGHNCVLKFYSFQM